MGTPSRLLMPPVRLVRCHAGGMLAVLLAVLLAGWWSVAVPLYEILDEQWHAAFVLGLADGHGLPVQQPDPAANPSRQEGSQPPLYYATAAVIANVVPRPPAMSTFTPNPHGFIGIPLAEGNKAMAVHGPAERFPWTGEPLALHLVRFYSAILAGLSVAAIYALALEIVPAHRSLATLSALIAACLPAFTFVSASVNNDNLMNAVGPWTVVVAIRVGRAPLTIWRSAFLGLLLGIALLAKLSGLALIPLAGLAIVRAAWSYRAGPRHGVAHGAIVVAMGAVIAGWWYWRNWILYGDPTGLSRFLDVVGRRSLTPVDLVRELGDLRFNFWALFGGVNILGPEWLYWVTNVSALLAALGLASVVLRPGGWRRVRARIDWWAALVGALWLAAIAVSFLRWTAMTMGTQGRLLYPALGIVTLALAAGLRLAGTPGRSRAHWALPVAFVGVLLVGNIESLVHSVLPEYAPPRRLPVAQSGLFSHPVDVRFRSGVRLVGYDVDLPVAGRHYEAAPGRSAAITLYWETDRRLDRNWSVFVHVLGDGERSLGAIDFYPGSGNWPTTFWDPDEIVVDRLYVPLRSESTVPTLARLELGLYTLATLERDAVVASDREVRGNGVTLDWVAVRKPLLAAAPVGQAPVALGSVVWRSSQGDMAPGDVQPGARLTVEITWRAGSFLPDDLTGFVQLIGDQTNPATGNPVWAQSDHRAGPPGYPPSAWAPGEAVADVHTVQLPDRLPPGAYRWIAGLYAPAGGARWPITSATGTATEAELGSVVVR